MSHEIIFLGSGGGKYVLSSNTRNCSGFVLNLNNDLFVIDPGPCSLFNFLKLGLKLEDIKGIFVSHVHLNHCNDLNLFIDAVTQGGVEKKGSVYCGESVLNYLSEVHKGYLDKFEVMDVGKLIKVGKVNVQALKTKHKDESCIGFKFFSDRFVLSYSGDTGYFSGLAEEYFGSDILILNNLNPFNSRKSDNLRCEDSVNLINKVKPKLVILTHFGVEMLKVNPTYEAREIRKKSGVDIVVANDGLIVDPISYLKRGRQKRLSFF